MVFDVNTDVSGFTKSSDMHSALAHVFMSTRAAIFDKVPAHVLARFVGLRRSRCGSTGGKTRNTSLGFFQDTS